MVSYPLEVHVTDIAKWLKKRKDDQRSTVLFLGSRAGGLFRCKTLYSTVQYYSYRTFDNMSRVEQFGECYRILHQEDFSRDDIANILLASLRDLEVSEADIALSELVRAGVFDTIISMNSDDLLKRAFERTRKKGEQGIQVFNPLKDFIDDMKNIQSDTPYLLIKVFGDLEKENSSLIRHDLYFDTHEKLSSLLKAHLQNNVLMIGYDFFWDRIIDTVLPDVGQEIWYVNEKPVQPALLSIMQKREGKYIVGGEGSYEQFIRTLHWYLVKEKPLDVQVIRNSFVDASLVINATRGLLPIPSEPLFNITETFPLPILSEDKKQQRKRVFICYSKSDKIYFKQLKNHLAVYDRKSLIDVWDETKIKLGDNWREEIKKTLEVTRIAILLISAEFLASRFIEESVLPPLLQAAEDGGAIILPVLLSPCIIEDTPLQQFFLPDELLMLHPLAAMRRHDRDEIWANLVRYVITLMKNA